MTSHEAPICGYVVQILNTHQLVLNIGSKDGVTKDMQFDVLYPASQDIVDPITKEHLGSLNLPKKRVIATRILDRLSVATTLSKRVNRGGAGIGLDVRLADIYDSPRWVTEYESLAQSDDSFAPLDEKDSFVKVKDPVMQVLPDEADEESEAAGQGGLTAAVVAS